VPDNAARLENIVASHLLKLCHFLYDAHGYKADLKFLRDVDGREVDFLVLIDGAPWMAIEVKTSGSSASKHLDYFRSRLSIPYCYQIVGEKKIDIMTDGIRVTSAENLLGALV
jgi:predicted AAA+ superfamily ATPase